MCQRLLPIRGRPRTSALRTEVIRGSRSMSTVPPASSARRHRHAAGAAGSHRNVRGPGRCTPARAHVARPPHLPAPQSASPPTPCPLPPGRAAVMQRARCGSTRRPAGSKAHRPAWATCARGSGCATVERRAPSCCSRWSTLSHRWPTTSVSPDGFPPSSSPCTCAKPAPGWLRISTSSVNFASGFLEEDAEIWDCADRLVAQARQLAKVAATPSAPTSRGWVV